jgi:hypothetical protein
VCRVCRVCCVCCVWRACRAVCVAGALCALRAVCGVCVVCAVRIIKPWPWACLNWNGSGDCILCLGADVCSPALFLKSPRCFCYCLRWTFSVNTTKPLICTTLWIELVTGFGHLQKDESLSSYCQSKFWMRQPRWKQKDDTICFANRALNFDWQITLNEITLFVRITNCDILFHGAVYIRRFVPMHFAMLLQMDLLCVLCLGVGVGSCVRGLPRLWSQGARVFQCCAVRCLTRTPFCVRSVLCYACANARVEAMCCRTFVLE